MTTSCPCGRPGSFGTALPYERCCGRYLDDAGTPAPDAESLMRSRYTAYVRGRSDYLLASWDATRRPRRVDAADGTQWLGLQVIDHSPTGPDTAEVEFVASYRDRAGRAGRLHERSRFAHRDGRWFYVDGTVTGSV